MPHTYHTEHQSLAGVIIGALTFVLFVAMFVGYPTYVLIIQRRRDRDAADRTARFLRTRTVDENGWVR